MEVLCHIYENIYWTDCYGIWFIEASVTYVREELLNKVFVGFKKSINDEIVYLRIVILAAY